MSRYGRNKCGLEATTPRARSYMKFRVFQMHTDKSLYEVSWFDPGAESVSRPLSYVFHDVSGSVRALVGRVGITSEEAEK